MPQLGNLGSQLFEAAKESNSSVATLITNQKHTIEKERTPQLQKVETNSTPRRRSKKRRPQSKRHDRSQKPSSSEASPSVN